MYLAILIIGLVLIFVSLFVVINNFFNAIKNLRDDIKELSREIAQDNTVNKQKLNEINRNILNLVKVLTNKSNKKL